MRLRASDESVSSGGPSGSVPVNAVRRKVSRIRRSCRSYRAQNRHMRIWRRTPIRLPMGRDRSMDSDIHRVTSLQESIKTPFSIRFRPADPEYAPRFLRYLSLPIRAVFSISFMFFAATKCLMVWRFVGGSRKTLQAHGEHRGLAESMAAVEAPRPFVRPIHEQRDPGKPLPATFPSEPCRCLSGSGLKSGSWANNSPRSETIAGRSSGRANRISPAALGPPPPPPLTRAAGLNGRTPLSRVSTGPPGTPRRVRCGKTPRTLFPDCPTGTLS